MRARHRALAAILLTVTVAGCAPEPEVESTPADLTVRIVRTLPHDQTAFTQGLEVSGERLIEGTGQIGGTRVTATDLDTGTERARVDVPAVFGEGITVAGDILWQLTWKDGVAIARDPDTLAETRRVTYDGEGWGLCSLGEQLIQSDGTGTLTFRDPATFDARGQVDVVRDGESVSNLNELECTPDGVYANVWQTDRILRIDPDSGKVTAVIDASPLRDTLGDVSVDVLNGIAALPGTDKFLLTGKLWPSMFEIEFVPVS